MKRSKCMVIIFAAVCLLVSVGTWLVISGRPVNQTFSNVTSTLPDGSGPQQAALPPDPILIDGKGSDLDDPAGLR